ncbi:hypothetical protein KY284_023172 [Solanum tuberosum]|nr:hypothetical protein KY284_023172 [Solanum tuberosum]
MEKSGMKLPYSFTGVFLPSNLVKQMVVPRIGFRTAGSFYLSVRLNTDLIQANVEILAVPEGSIVVNTTGQAIGPKDKSQRVPRIRQSNTSFAWDPD